MKVTVKIPPPHSDIQREIYQFLVNKNGPRFLWLACGTKFGKTWSGAAALSYCLPRLPGTLNRWVAPIYKQTKFGWNYMKKMLPGPPYTDFQKGEMNLHIPAREVDLQFWHGQNPEDMEGAGVSAQVNDEAAKLKEQVWHSSTTTWTMTQAKVINMSTPRGKNWFYRGCMRAMEEEQRAIREKRVPLEVFRSAPTSANPFVPRSVIAEAKSLLPTRLFDQYYNAVFVDDDSVFPVPEVDRENLGVVEQKGDEIRWKARGYENLNVVAGVDWAKRGDFTVATVIDFEAYPFRVVGILRLQQGMRYTNQVVEVVRFLREFKSLEIMYHDRTGVGDAIDDMLDAVPNLVYKGVTFTNASKAHMVSEAITGLEKQDTLFPDCPLYLTEMHTYEVTTNDLGNMRYSAPEGSHDDCVSSFILAYAAAKEYSDNSFEVTFLEDIGNIKTEKDPWEEYLYDSLDIDPDEGF